MKDPQSLKLASLIFGEEQWRMQRFKAEALEIGALARNQSITDDFFASGEAMMRYPHLYATWLTQEQGIPLGEVRVKTREGKDIIQFSRDQILRTVKRNLQDPALSAEGQDRLLDLLSQARNASPDAWFSTSC